MKKIAFELPINQVSFGNISYLLLRTLFEQEKTSGQKYDIFLFPIGNIDLSNQVPNEEFNKWIQSKIQNGLENYSREIPAFKLWHLSNGSVSQSKNPLLLSFYELDSPTAPEKNAARNNKTYFTSKYTCDVFKSVEVETQFLPLGFDNFSYKTINKKYHNDDRIVTCFAGKWEKRKGFPKAIPAWIRKYGNNPKYALQCAIYNPFLNEQQNQQLIGQMLQGQPKPFNVNFYPPLAQNQLYNEFLNSCDIIVSLGTESWSLPAFHAVGMGKHAVILNCNGHKEWATSENSVLVEPSGMESAVDGMFFQPTGNYNLGNIFSFTEDAFIAGCESAIQRVQKDRINHAGLKLQQDFSKEKFVDAVLVTFQ